MNYGWKMKQFIINENQSTEDVNDEESRIGGR